MSSDTAALFVHRASRTELLAAKLADALDAQRPANPLAAQTIVVAHPGLRRWLLGEFARRPGPNGAPGIAANFTMLQPWQWLEQVARRVLGDVALIGGEYQREMLRWRIFRVLPAIHDPQIEAYLRDGDLGPAETERRRFQLAEHLAGVFSQYLIYRPDWIADWERDSSTSDWQADIWRLVRSEIVQAHRAERRDALLQALAECGDGEAMPLHVFGVSHLPPDILATLGALALHRAVHIYFPDPCHEHWSYLRGERDLLKRYDDPQALHFEVGHPLLVGLGRMAQDFCLALEDHDAIDQSNADDDADSPKEPANLLTQLQSSIRYCEPDLVGAVLRESLGSAGIWQELLLRMRDDASLRIHACHTRLRELEVLKDALLARLTADPSLQHRDIVVMAPNIESYAPYLAAVFGEPARFSRDPSRIPWHLADVGLARTHPLMSAFARLLELPESRFAVSDVMDFLDVPAVARRFDIETEDRETLERWLHRARVAWGLDAPMKAASGAAAIDANSWKFGFDRLYAGLIAGSDVPGELLDDIFPVSGIGGAAVEALGGLDRMLTTLRRARSGYARPRSLGAWCESLLNLIDAVFLADTHDEREITALDNLRREIAQLSEQSESAGPEAVLPWSVMREAVRGALDEQSQRQPFLLGGVTFCGMVPQRSIPFRVVCVLGMNEGEFPRQNNAAGLNRMLARPRSG
ncbi:MAG: exodeoxyribonuclease V subunit gamma, partial [Rudaea sp.]